MDKKDHYWWIDSQGKLQLTTYAEMCAVLQRMARQKFQRESIETAEKEK